MLHKFERRHIIALIGIMNGISAGAGTYIQYLDIALVSSFEKHTIQKLIYVLHGNHEFHLTVARVKALVFIKFAVVFFYRIQTVFLSIKI